MVSDMLTKLKENANKVPRGELIKGIIYGTAYLFMLTITGILVVTLYNYIFPIDVTSEISVFNVSFLFAIWIAIDLVLVNSGNPTPTLMAILVIIAPILIIYRFFKSSDLIQIDRTIPTRLKRYIPPKFIIASDRTAGETSDFTL